MRPQHENPRIVLHRFNVIAREMFLRIFQPFIDFATDFFPIAVRFSLRSERI